MWWSMPMFCGTKPITFRREEVSCVSMKKIMISWIKMTLVQPAMVSLGLWTSSIDRVGVEEGNHLGKYKVNHQEECLVVISK